METKELGGGISRLLTFSILAGHVSSVLDEILAGRVPLSDSDRDALGRAQRLLDFAADAQREVGGERMTSFSIEGMQVRRATYKACRRARAEPRVELLSYLDGVGRIIARLREGGAVPTEETHEARSFFTAVRDVFRTAASTPLEVVEETGISR